MIFADQGTILAHRANHWLPGFSAISTKRITLRRFIRSFTTLNLRSAKLPRRRGGKEPCSRETTPRRDKKVGAAKAASANFAQEAQIGSR
jgi:hypothetical protein